MYSTSVEHQKIVFNEPNSPFIYVLNSGIVGTKQEAFNSYWHEELEIKYIIKGSMHINFGTNVVRAEAGDIVVVNSCECHVNQVADGDDAVYHLLCVDLAEIFNGGILERCFLPYKNGALRFKNVIRKDDALNNSLQQLFESLQNKDDLLLSLGRFVVFYSLLTNHIDHEKISKLSDKRSARQIEILNTAFSYIHSHYNEVIMIEDVANKCFMTKSHFCRIFKEITGETPIHYINKLKINRAITLLTGSNLSIKEIANSLGFDDTAYFCRCFKKYTGLSSSSYLKEHKKGKRKPLMDHDII